MGRVAVLNKCPETMCILQNNGPSRDQSPEPRAFKKSQLLPGGVGLLGCVFFQNRPQRKTWDIRSGGGWGKCQEEILECENVVVRKCLGLIKVLASAGSGNCVQVGTLL